MGYESAALALAPKLFYKLDEASGATVTDYGSLGTNGTISNTPNGYRSTSLYYGGVGALDLTSGGAYMSTTGLSAMAGWSGYTFCGWWRSGSTFTGDPYLMVMGWAAGSSIPLALGTNTSSGTFRAGNFDGSSWNYVTSATTISVNTTYFVAATLSSLTSGTLTLYINAVSEGTPRTGLNTASWTQSTLYVNHQWDSTGVTDGYFQGFGAWDSALSGTQIADLYSANQPSRAIRPQQLVTRSSAVQTRSRRY